MKINKRDLIVRKQRNDENYYIAQDISSVVARPCISTKGF